jgi:hypothetical protein
MKYNLKKIIENGDLKLKDCTKEIWNLDVEIDEDGFGKVNGVKKQTDNDDFDNKLIEMNYIIHPDGSYELVDQLIKLWFQILDCNLKEDFIMWCQEANIINFKIDDDYFFGCPLNFEFINEKCIECKHDDLYDLITLEQFVEWLNAKQTQDENIIVNI